MLPQRALTSSKFAIRTKITISQKQKYSNQWSDHQKMVIFITCLARKKMLQVCFSVHFEYRQPFTTKRGKLTEIDANFGQSCKTVSVVRAQKNPKARDFPRTLVYQMDRETETFSVQSLRMLMGSKWNITTNGLSDESLYSKDRLQIRAATPVPSCRLYSDRTL